MSQPDYHAMANAIRFLAMDAIESAGEGHQGVPLGMAEIAAALYADHLKFDAADPRWPDRDRVILSNGHGSMLLYALQYLTGNAKITLDQIRDFRRLGSHCAGHPEYDPDAGIEVTTGPLGQGIANAVGMAVAEETLRARLGAGHTDHHIFAFVGDGCLQEGVGQEAIALAGHLKLSRLIFLWDDNRITDDGSTDLSISEDVAARFRIAGWHVEQVDGHDPVAVSAAILAAKASPLPSMIACRTIIARGIARLEGRRGGHSARLFGDDLASARERFGWNSPAFMVPEGILAAWRATSDRGKAAHAAWRARNGSAEGACENWRAALRDYGREMAETAPTQPTIQSSGEAIARIAGAMPGLIVACADLEAPTNHKRDLPAFTANDRHGRYVHCGVREHLMGAMANGMATYGLTPLSVTYLAFADYQRPAMRMAALMGLPVPFVFSHDSIGVGTNGPTHQPVEILASCRAMPNMLVFRPADAVETAECWETALSQGSRPSTLVFCKQPVPALRTGHAAENLARRGAYILAEPQGARHVTLLATGSEVAVALAARAILQAEGIGTAVVSMPCWELFDEQDPAYRDAVLGPQTVRIAVEAAVQQGWTRYIGMDGGFVGMTGFGASGPADQLFAHFGITPERVAAEARCRLG